MNCHADNRFVLARFGQKYACWGATPGEVIRMATEHPKPRPWWWLRLMGWSVRRDSCEQCEAIRKGAE